MLLKEAKKHEAVEYYLNKLSMAEAFNFAYVGSKPDKGRRNARAFKTWQMKIQRRIARLQGRKTTTLWDKIKARKRNGV